MSTDFKATIKFIRTLSFNYSFIGVTVTVFDVSFYNIHKFIEIQNNSKADINGSILVLTSLFFHLLVKQNPDVRIKIIPLAMFSFIGYSVKYFKTSKPYKDNQSQSITVDHSFSQENK